MKNKKIISMITFLYLLSINVNVNALMKDETVYTKLNQDGSVKSIVVNEYLKNTSKQDSMEDISNLEDIVNVHSNHSFTQNNFNLTWKSLGSDIFYQGKIQKELPINVKISYELNGKNYKATDMIGKSGKVKITLKYENKDKHVVYVNGKKETLYTPFVVTTGLMINGKNNSDVKVTNGKVINNGNGYVIAGLSAPGVYESMNMDELKGLDEITITYDTKKFELSSIYSAFTPKLIENSDLEAFDKLGSISSDVMKLTSSMNKIEEGSKSLHNGINEAYHGSNTIKTKVSESINNLKQDNQEVLDEKTLEGIKISAMKSAEIPTEELNLIAKKASMNTVLSDEVLNEIATNALNSVGEITLSDEQKAAIVTNVNQMIEEKYADEIKNSARNEVDLLLSNIISQLSFTKEQMIALSGDQINDDVANVLATNLNHVLSNKLVSSKEQIYALTENSAMESAKKIAQMSAINAASLSANQTANALTPEVARNVAITVAPSVAGETSKVVAMELSPEVAGKVAPIVASKVATAVKNEATNKIASSMTTLNDGLTTLTDGLSKLNDGSNELVNGIHTFNREGIMKISVLSNKAGEIKDKLEVLAKLGNEYETFTMKSDDTEGTTKFVMVTDSLKAKEEVKSVIKTKEEETLWTRIKNLFH